LRSDTASSYLIDEGKLIIQSDSAALFKTCFLEVGKGSGSSPAYSLLPRYTVLNRGVVIKLRRDPTRMNQSLLYRNASRGSWSLASTLRQGEYIVDTLTRWLGDISLQTDVTPPVVKRIVTPQRYSKQPHHVSFRVGDNLSGVEYKELKLYIDNMFVIPEIDGEHRRVVNRLAQPLKRGRHTLRIVLKDRLGNVREVQHAFRVR
jgi:hypothetical protein